MNISRQKTPYFLLLGDVFFLFLSLLLTLGLRYGFMAIDEEFFEHLAPFSILFIVWILVFFIVGLYEKHTVILQNKIPSIIFRSQIFNTILAVLFFYFVPFFGITPKINLFIYLGISFLLILLWRTKIRPFIGFTRKQKAILIGSGEEMRELKEEVNQNSRYNLIFVSSVDLNEVDSLDFEGEILERIYSEEISVVAIDLRNEKVAPVLPHLYNLIFSKVRFIDMNKIYEDIFDRVPLSLVKHNWFLENISLTPKRSYDFLKRSMDIVLSVALGTISLIFYPFVYIAIKLEDRGPLFISQERIGKNNQHVKIYKFRSMTKNDHGKYDTDEENVVTKVGAILRKSRIDELPQLWNVLRGDISLIGPRPELPELAKVYEREIPYYNIRHLIKPGLSGWAQIYHENHPHHKEAVNDTKDKLSYDLYYIKNRSFMVDLKIALRTIEALLSRTGI